MRQAEIGEKVWNQPRFNYSNRRSLQVFKK